MAPPKAKRRRLDALLVAQGLAPNLEKARAFVMAGQVMVNEQRATAPAALVAEDVELRVKRKTGRFVSRGGEKLDGALAELGLKDAIAGSVILDVGASTGGFTHCCLELGAKLVLALDVGTNQLAWQLRSDPRVKSLEQTDIKAFDPTQHPPVQWVVADISFQSLGRLAPELRRAAPWPGVHFLVLVKPQFELAKSEVGEGGIVVSDTLRAKALASVQDAFSKCGLTAGRAVQAKLAGRKGNREIFYYVRAP